MIARKKPIEVEVFKVPEKFMPGDEQTPEWLLEAWMNRTLNGDVEDELGGDEHLVIVFENESTVRDYINFIENAIKCNDWPPVGKGGVTE